MIRPFSTDGHVFLRTDAADFGCGLNVPKRSIVQTCKEL